MKFLISIALVSSAILFGVFLMHPVAAAVAPAALTLATSTIPQGGTTVFIVTPTASGTVRSVVGWVGSRRIWFFQNDGRWLGFYSAPAKAAPGVYRARILVNGSYTIPTLLTVTDAKFRVTNLVISKALAAQGFSPKSVEASITGSDNVAVLGAALHPVAGALFSTAFQYPLSGITGPNTTMNVGAFGDYRTSGGVQLQHLGVDLEAATGTPVYAVNNGVVTLTKRLWDYGNTIVVDHGAHIFSLYLHLSQFAVKKGARVTKGQVIGYSGQTGYALAPHLHLSMWDGGKSIDPLAFIAESQAVMK